MNQLSRFRSLWRATEGQDLLEYALLAALVALVCYTAVQSTGTNVDALFNRIATTMAGAAA